MSDFGELCPLFNTGVYSEITFTGINGGTGAYGTSITINMLEGAGPAGLFLTVGCGPTMFTFGRTVVVTGAFLQRTGTNLTAQNLILGHKTTQAAAATAFATATLTNSVSVYTASAWFPFTVSASKTFTSSEVLSLTIGTVTADTIGTYNLIVQYRDK